MNLQQLERMAADANKQLERAADGLARIAKFPADDFEVGTIIAFDRRFEPDGKIYNYAGVKLPNGGWVITGRRHNGLTVGWDDLIAELAQEGECLAFVVMTDCEDLIEPIDE